MMSDKQTLPQSKKNITADLELVKWLIARSDVMRSSTSQRAAIVVSADALLIGALSVILARVLSPGNPLTPTLEFFYRASAAIAGGLLIVSILYATGTIVFWRPVKEAVLRTKSDHYQNGRPRVLFFKARDTAETFHNIQSLEKEFSQTTPETMLNYALGEFLLTSKAQHLRYQRFRTSVRFLMVATILFTFLLFGQIFS